MPSKEGALWAAGLLCRRALHGPALVATGHEDGAVSEPSLTTVGRMAGKSDRDDAGPSA